MNIHPPARIPKVSCASGSVGANVGCKIVGWAEGATVGACVGARAATVTPDTPTLPLAMFEARVVGSVTPMLLAPLLMEATKLPELAAEVMDME